MIVQFRVEGFNATMQNYCETFDDFVEAYIKFLALIDVRILGNRFKSLGLAAESPIEVYLGIVETLDIWVRITSGDYTFRFEFYTPGNSVAIYYYDYTKSMVEVLCSEGVLLHLKKYLNNELLVGGYYNGY